MATSYSRHGDNITLIQQSHKMQNILIQQPNKINEDKAIRD